MSARRRSLALRALLALVIAGAAFGLRWRAIGLLPVDYDEGWYLEAAQRIARVLAAGDLGALTAPAMNLRPEHPQLAKLVFGAALVGAPHSEPSPARGFVGGGSSPLPEAQLLAATRQMQQEARAYNLQYLQLQEGMQRESREFTALSNVLKVKHDSAKSAIHNIQ